jgi:GNAT superfamily N-acetyltransferase
MVVNHGGLFDSEDAIAIDHLAQESEERHAWLRRVFRGNQGEMPIVARASRAEDAPLSGYAILEYSFFDQGFLSMLYVAQNARRTGVASALVNFAEQLCQRPKLFSSTNLSNAPMHALFARFQYTACGMVTGLDAHDPEVFYVKQLRHGDV